ncbi:primase [Shewanella phage S0112]|nr:primase [Shewanella phage S0112]
MLKNIPQELCELKQWVCATKSEVKEKDKIPINPATGKAADPKDPSTWGTYEEAVNGRTQKNPHIGFVLTEDDPYTIIDLDDPYDPKHNWSDEKREQCAALNERIFNAFESYTELSQSGNGVHIIVRGCLPKGSRRDTVEVYPFGRMIITTGNILKDLPITDQQPLLNILFAEVNKDRANTAKLVELDADLSDDEIIEMAMNADNGEKFTALCNGDFCGLPSQSEADLALMSILAFYTKSNEQVRRIFRMTELGKREKAVKNDRYLNFTLERVRANLPEIVDVSEAQERVLAMMTAAGIKPFFKDTPNEEEPPIPICGKDNESEAPALSNGDPGENKINPYDAATIAASILSNAKRKVVAPSLYAGSKEKAQQCAESAISREKDQRDRSRQATKIASPGEDFYPPGLIGDIAKYITESAARPVPDVGLIAAIGMVAGICGRQYNVSGTGLNQYLIFLAKTGMGKEGIASGIERLIRAVRKNIPSVVDFRGPGTFASGQALVRFMSEQPNFFSILGEFGMTLKHICDPRAIQAMSALRQTLLDLYQKSGWHSTLQKSVYSDKDKNTGDIQSPALTIIGESTPETFFEGLTEFHIQDGLIPRFSIREYTGMRPYLNKNSGFNPSDSLVNDLTGLVESVLSMNANDSHVDVLMDAEATSLSDELEKYSTDIINTSEDRILCQLWNRAHLKTIKLAALIAVGTNYHSPVVTGDMFRWALDFTKQDINLITNKFRRGEIGQGADKLELDMKRKIAVYFGKVPKANYKKAHSNGIIPYSWLKDNVRQMVSYKNDPRGQMGAFKSTLEALVEANELEIVPKPQAKALLGQSVTCYALGPMWNPAEEEKE